MVRSIIVLILFAVVIFTSGCGDAPADEPEGAYIEGSYTGSAEGYNEEVELEVIVEGGSISEINITAHAETESIAEPAFEETIDNIIANQSTEGVDTVSGATLSSEAVINAVDQALTGAEN